MFFNWGLLPLKKKKVEKLVKWILKQETWHGTAGSTDIIRYDFCNLTHHDIPGGNSKLGFILMINIKILGHTKSG